MHLTVVQRILGLLLMLFSATMLPPLGVSLLYGDGAWYTFVVAFGITLAVGVASWLPVRGQHRELRLRDGFVVVVMFWTVLSATGALPFVLAEHPHLSLTDAFFESISGLTTTGATVITGLDGLPESILYYRQQLQWLGGMGIIVLAVAVLPMLGIGGMQLYKAETPGPIKDSKLTPRITETAKALWFIYLGLTVACALGYWLAGMNAFDALAHAFSTVAIGGFSTHDASMGYFDSTAIYLVGVVFMFLAGVNFALHFSVVRSIGKGFDWRALAGYWRDSEFRFYVLLMLLVVVATTTGLHFTDTHEYLLLFSSFVGGCAGSTGGGIKVIRFLLLIKQGAREILRLIHPNAQIPVRVGEKTIPPRVVEAVWGFFALYVASFTVMYLALAATGIDLMTAFSAVAASINNLGPGLENVGANYAGLHDPAKWILCFAMLLGRLEIFTLLVLLSPAFWQR